MFSRILINIAVVIAWSQVPRTGAEEPLKLGIVGLDTWHAVTFTQLLNDPTDPNHVPGAVVTVTYDLSPVAGPGPSGRRCSACLQESAAAWCAIYLLVREIPTVLRTELYAVAALIGAAGNWKDTECRVLRGGNSPRSSLFWRPRPGLYVTATEPSRRFYLDRLGFTSLRCYDEEGSARGSNAWQGFCASPGSPDDTESWQGLMFIPLNVEPEARDAQMQ